MSEGDRRDVREVDLCQRGPDVNHSSHSAPDRQRIPGRDLHFIAFSDLILFHGSSIRSRTFNFKQNRH